MNLLDSHLRRSSLLELFAESNWAQLTFASEDYTTTKATIFKGLGPRDANSRPLLPQERQ
jgi:hypothetical protein